MDLTRYDTIVVGGGIAGLTSAVYLAREGQKVLLIEKNKEFGGLVSTIKRDGFHFEAGVRALESAGVILPMLEDLGIELERVRSKVSVGIADKILNIEDLDSIPKYQKLLIELYPESKNEIIEFIKTMRKIMKHLDVLYGIENPLFKDLKKDTSYIFKKLLPWFPRFAFTVRKINKLNMPVEDYLKEIIKNESLRDIISQHFFKGTPTFFALSYFSLYLDYFYPVGGVGKLAEAIENKLIEYNGELKPNTLITKIKPAEKKITDQDGNNYLYDKLVWAADLKSLYRISDTKDLSADKVQKIELEKEKILKHKGSESVFTLFMELDLPLNYFSEIAHGHFFFTPSKTGLGDIHRSELDNMINNWESVCKESLNQWLDRFIQLNTYEISIPGLKDSSLAPKDKTGLIVSFLIPYSLFEKIEQSSWLEEIQSGIEERLIDLLSNTVYPELKSNLIKKFSYTPLSIRKRIDSTDGSIVGWSFQGSLPVINQIQKAGKSVFTPIPGVFQAGQWAYSPAGVPMSILTGKIAADRIIKESKK
jgi:phytoene dehydrogenase-like protein